MSVKDGRLVLPGGMTYRVLVLPDTGYMTPRMANKVKELVQAGATVIGPRPIKSPSAADRTAADAEVAKIAAEVWGDCDGKTIKEHASGKGRVVWGTKVQEVLAGMKVGPDCTLTTSGDVKARGAWIHRRVEGAEVYFVSNQNAKSQEIVCSFRVSGMDPELWHADTGVMEAAPIWWEKDGRTNVVVAFEPSGSVFVVFRSKEGQRRASASSPYVSVKLPVSIDQQRKMPKIEITKAVYEAVDGAGSADVTAKVAAMIAGGETEVAATNSMLGEPAYNHVKRLRVEYTLDGKATSMTVAENATLVFVDTSGPDLPSVYRMERTPSGSTVLCAFQSGSYELMGQDGQGHKIDVKAVPAPIGIGGPWAVKFQQGRGAPESTNMASLASWSKSADAGVKYFSGTAEYETDFDVPANAVGAGKVQWLNLGSVKEIAEVTLNGKKLGEGGVWWKPPFEGDVTGVAKAGKNTLKIRVTNTWANRLIGDEQFPDDSEWNGITIKKWPDWFKPGAENPLAGRPVKERLTFTTWKHWHKDSPAPDSGLLGPVQLRIGERVELK